MGLDITAYSKLTPSPDEPMQDDCVVDWEKAVQLRDHMIDWSNETFPGMKRAEGIQPGVYRFSESLGFRAGSYSGYSTWRHWLAQVAGFASARTVWETDPTPIGPFVELINFADNEGYIGPVVAAKLLQDFRANRERVEASWADDKWNLECYRNWERAFELAADGGVVEFH